MTLLFAAFLVVHGLIHLFATAKAWGVAGLPQLAQQIEYNVAPTTRLR